MYCYYDKGVKILSISVQYAIIKAYTNENQSVDYY